MFQVMDGDRFILGCGSEALAIAEARYAARTLGYPVSVWSNGVCLAYVGY